MTESLLDQLARQRGIGDAYHNYRGDLMTISRETKAAILAAMGCPVGDEAALRQALAQREGERWRSLLPAVAVVHPGRRTVPVTLSTAMLDRHLAWRVDCADGSDRRGEAHAGDLQEVERVDVDGLALTRRLLRLADDLPPGQHALHVTLGDDHVATAVLIAAPGACYEPGILREGHRLWGVAVQLYTLRSARNWGIGDFADLDEVVRGCAEAGASFVGLNPLHALFPGNPWHFSPYSASSRHFLNVLYVAVDRLPELDECEAARRHVAADGFQAELRRLRATPNVDYPGVARAKLGVLELLFEHFRREHLQKGSRRARQFREFQAERGDSLHLHALHDAVDEHLRAGDAARYWGWPAWPAGLSDPRGPDVAVFERTHAARVEYHAWLQWLADQQLRQAQRVARECGMAIGLYGDYAVGVNPSGSETWSDQALYRKGAGVGAPPDALALKGQDWGIPPQDPRVLEAEHYRPFRELLAASMRYFGALRLDHVMALFRQWWVPVGLGATDGGYVHYPVDDLMSVLALESQLHRCLVVGEDLGTVPPEMCHAMAERAVYSYRVLLFEKHPDGRFKRPDEYSRRAIATVTTHDLPTLKGYWTASDIELRERLSLYPSAALRDQVAAERVRDRAALVDALRSAQLAPGSCDVRPEGYGDALNHAVHVYLARSAAALVVLQAEDLAGMADPVNVPGTSDEHANWQRKMSCPMAEVFALARVQRLFGAVQEARSHLSSR